MVALNYFNILWGFDMKIVVCMKQVPNTKEVKIDKITGSLNRDGVLMITNPDDLYALEEALRLKDILKSEVVVITMGPLQAEVMLRESMAMGADSSILLSDKKFAASDTYVTAKVLSTAIKKINPDVIFTGKRSIDGCTSQVGVQIAAFLGIPQVTYVSNIETEDGKNFIATRTMGETIQKVRVSSPCLFTIPTNNNKIRYMAGGYHKKVTIWNADDLQIDASLLGYSGSPTRVVSSSIKQASKNAEMYNVSSEQSADIILKYLKKLHFVEG